MIPRLMHLSVQVHAIRTGRAVQVTPHLVPKVADQRFCFRRVHCKRMVLTWSWPFKSLSIVPEQGGAIVRCMPAIGVDKNGGVCTRVCACVRVCANSQSKQSKSGFSVDKNGGVCARVCACVRELTIETVEEWVQSTCNVPVGWLVGWC